MSPSLNRSSVLQHFKYGNVVKIHNSIMFYFYLGLPLMCSDFDYTLVTVKNRLKEHLGKGYAGG